MKQLVATASDRANMVCCVSAIGKHSYRILSVRALTQLDENTRTRVLEGIQANEDVLFH